jgi:hypothetical protein
MPHGRLRVRRAATLVLALGIGACSTQLADPSPTDVGPTTAPSLSSPTPTVEPSRTASESVVPRASSPATSPGPADGWVEVASFGSGDTIETVHDVVVAPFGVLAAGVHLPGRSLPVFGPTGQEGRIWLSSDGRTWDDVTPSGTFADASVDQLVARPDGSVLALGRVSRLVDGIPDAISAAWETRDGRSWSETEVRAGDARVFDIAAGGRGYLARIDVSIGEPGLAHSSDGRTFSRVGDFADGRWFPSIAAGTEGFVGLATRFESSEPPVVYASGDGVEWYEAQTPRWDAAAGVVAIGSDWIAVGSRSFEEEWSDTQVPTWFSANGLEWTETGAIPLDAISAGEDVVCAEFPSTPVGTGSLVTVSTFLSYPCAEGNVQGYGATHITADGATWALLPFAVGAELDADTRGTSVSAGTDLAAGTLLVGERDYQATFWLRLNE